MRPNVPTGGPSAFVFRRDVSPDQVVLQLLPAAVADHEAGQRVARRLGPAHPTASPVLCGCDGTGTGVDDDESGHL